MKFFTAILFSLALLAVSCKETATVWQGITYESVSTSEAPFPMSDVQVPVFPDRTYTITDYGARPLPADSSGYPAAIDSSRIIRMNTQAFLRAMEDCSEAGGGHVVVPKGQWLTGPVQFRSNCDLYLSEGSVLVFSGRPDDFLPEVVSAWEGIQCMNYSPMIYALQCENIGISGTGMLRPIMTEWRKWFDNTPDHLKALQTLYKWGAFDEVFYNRNISGHAYKMRPPLIQFVVCTNIILQDFKIRESPFWSIHMYRCQEGAARRLDVYAQGSKNEGIDLEMTRRFVIEDCTFDQGDDAVAIKAGRNQEGWRVNQSSGDILIRNCTVKKGNVMLGIGTEVSSGIQNVYIHDCRATGYVDNLFYIKTNRRRGAYVDNIIMERCEARTMQRALAIDTDVMYEWRDIAQTLKDTVTAISNITMRDIKINKVIGLIDLNGDKDLPLKNVTVSKVQVDSVSSFVSHVENVEGYKEDSIKYKWYGRTREKLNILK